MKLFFIGAALLISVLSTDAQVSYQRECQWPFRHFGLAGKPGFRSDAYVGNSILWHPPFWFPRHFGSAWPFRHFDSTDRLRPEKLIHLMGKLVEACKNIFDQKRHWEPRGNHFRIISTLKVCCGSPLNLHHRPYLATYGYLGFPQGYPFYPQDDSSHPQDYSDVGTAEQLLPVVAQPYVPVVPHYYPSSSIFPGIASPEYPGTQQSKLWNPPVMDNYHSSLPQEPFPEQPLSASQLHSGSIPPALHRPQYSAGPALTDPPQSVPPAFAQSSHALFAQHATGALIKCTHGAFREHVGSIVVSAQCAHSVFVHSNPAVFTKPDSAVSAQPESIVTVQSNPAASTQSDSAAALQPNPAASTQFEPATTAQSNATASTRPDTAASAQSAFAPSAKDTPAASAQYGDSDLPQPTPAPLAKHTPTALPQPDSAKSLQPTPAPLAKHTHVSVAQHNHATRTQHASADSMPPTPAPSSEPIPASLAKHPPAARAQPTHATTRQHVRYDSAQPAPAPLAKRTHVFEAQRTPVAKRQRTHAATRQRVRYASAQPAPVVAEQPNMAASTQPTPAPSAKDTAVQ